MIQAEFLDYFTKSHIAHYLDINEENSDFMINGIYVIIHRKSDFSEVEKEAFILWFEKQKYDCEELKIEENRITFKGIYA